MKKKEEPVFNELINLMPHRLRNKKNMANQFQ